MKRILLINIMAVFAVISGFSQLKVPEGFSIIENQPEGELRIYNRTGSFVREIINYDDDTHYITTGTQDGSINLVFADDQKTVYMQRPISESYYEGWMKCTLSDDGKTITMPVGQYTAYTWSFDMGVQVWMMRYDAGQDTYVVDEDVTEVVFTVADDGSIALQGTDQQHILGEVNRCFGETFSYLDFEWLGWGDYESVLNLNHETLPTPPEGLQTESFIVSTGYHNGISWNAYNSTVNLGFDGDDVWLQGFTDLLPQAWVKGRRDGNTLTFPTGQLLGNYFDALVYMIGAEPDEKGEPVLTDIVFTYDGEGTYTSYTDAFVSSAKNDIKYIVYYMGMTLSTKVEEPLTVPVGLQTEEYKLAYQEPDENGNLQNQEAVVRIGIDTSTSTVYVQGITPLLPDAYIAGILTDDGKVTFNSPQFLDIYSDEHEGDFPIYFQAYNGSTGELCPTITFNYDMDTREFDSSSATIGIGICKTGLLCVQNMYHTTLKPVNPDAVNSIFSDSIGRNGKCYDLSGREIIDGQLRRGIYIRDGKKIIYK